MKAIKLILLFGLLVLVLYSTFLFVRLVQVRNLSRDDHLVLLAEQFSRGNLALSPLGLPAGDYVDYFGRQYLYFGPFSSVILMPFAALWGRTFPQIILGLFSLGVSFVAVFRLARRFEFDRVDSLWWALFFTFSTVLFGVAVINFSAYQVQALGTALILLSLTEFFGKKRFFLIGILIAMAGLTRITLYLSLLFPLFWATKSRKNLTFLLVPIILSLFLFSAYNYKRFHSIFETGYRYNVTVDRYPMSANLRFGLFSLSHVPTNLYALLVKSPDPVIEKGGGLVLKFPYLKVDPWGVALWFSSPLLLLLFGVKKREYFFPAVITIITLAAPSLLYFGIGYIQFGYRYALDFLPFLLILLLMTLRPKLSFWAIFLIALGVLFNCLYLASLWNYYPLWGIK